MPHAPTDRELERMCTLMKVIYSLHKARLEFIHEPVDDVSKMVSATLQFTLDALAKELGKKLQYPPCAFKDIVTAQNAMLFYLFELVEDYRDPYYHIPFERDLSPGFCPTPEEQLEFAEICEKELHPYRYHRLKRLEAEAAAKAAAAAAAAAEGKKEG